MSDLHVIFYSQAEMTCHLFYQKDTLLLTNSAHMNKE